MARRGGALNEDLSNIEFETSEDVEVVPTFNSMVSLNIFSVFINYNESFPFCSQGLREELLRAIYAYG